MEQYQIELGSIPKAYAEVIIQFIKKSTTEDELHEMILCCYDAWAHSKRDAASRAITAIKDYFSERNREENILYNPYRNISLNQCIGDSTTPVSEWLNVSDWKEWD